MKSNNSQSSSVSRPPTEPPTPDTASTAESTVVERINESTAPSPSPDGDATKKGNKTEGKDGEGEQGSEKGSNLVGKITNLVSTDLGNLVDGRDFPVLFISLPLHVIFCVVFLYRILGWSAIAGTVTMVALYPIPGWIASKMQTVQKERMKFVSHSSPMISREFLLFYCRPMRAFRSFLKS